MKKIILLGFVFINGISFSQSREDSLQKVINYFFTCMKKNDINGFSKIVDSQLELKTVLKFKDSVQVYSSNFSEFQSMMSEPLLGEWEEKLINFTFLNDELMSTIWTEYEFHLNGVMTHSGTNQFTIIKNTESDFGWKIISIIDTRYKKGKGNLTHAELTKIESKNINLLIDKWHKYAAKADGFNFFSTMSDSCIYKGTDKTERWNKTEFQSFCKPFFDKGKAWNFKPLERNIRFDDALNLAWFDERLDTWMGECKATGILKKENGEWKIWLYDLSVTIDNDKIKSFIELTAK